jgi:toxin ParE1/3/4
MRRALWHLADIEEYIARDRPLAAKGVGDRLRSSFAFLCEFPDVGRPGREAGTREWPIPDLPYTVVFRSGKEMLDIVGVFHNARKYRT